MKAYPQHRKSQRFQSNRSVLLEDFRTGYFYKGALCNHSSGGGYVESAYAPRPGRKIHIKMDGEPDVKISLDRRAEIRWRRSLFVNPNSYTYGMGLKYC